MSEPQTRRLAHIPSIAGYGISSIAALLTVLFAGLIAYVTMYDAPYWDLWQHVNRDNLLKDLFTRNNEHPVVSNRLLFWIDDSLFGASSRFVQVVSLTALAGQVLLFVWLAKLAGIARPVLAVAPTAIVFVFYPFGFENTIWIFQVSMVLAFTSAVGGFVCYARYVQDESLAALVGSIAFAILAVVSFANGVLVPTLLVAMALWLKPRSVIPFVVIAAAAWGWQLTAPNSSGSPGGSLSLETLEPITTHFLTQLGGPIGWAAGYLPKFGAPPINNLHVSLQAGVIAAILSVAALAFIVLRRRRDPSAMAAAAIILFALGTAALVALSRFSFGPAQALSSRYSINAALLYSTLLIVALMARTEAPESWRRWLPWGGALLAVPLVVIGMTGAPMFGDLTGRYRAGMTGAVALVAGTRDLGSVGQLSPDYDAAVRETDEFRKNGKWMFAALTPRRMGETLSAGEAVSPVCTGSTWKASGPDEKEGFRVGDGSLVRQNLSVGAIHVLITDATGVIVGYGKVPRRASDLNPFAQQDGARIDWIGRIRSNMLPPFRAWLADDRSVRCALGVSQPEEAS